jgi:hypothetical protein
VPSTRVSIRRHGKSVFGDARLSSAREFMG